MIMTQDTHVTFDFTNRETQLLHDIFWHAKAEIEAEEKPTVSAAYHQFILDVLSQLAQVL